MLAQNSYETIGNEHRLRVNSNGSLGIDLATLTPSSNQKGTQNNYLNQAGLWLVAEDYDGKFYTSIQHLKSKDSFDFWPGPVDTLTGQTGSISEWNKVWRVTKQLINEHQSNYQAAGYVVPQPIASWPVDGGNGFSQYLAPFVDANNNQMYDPENGDYPYIFGDTAVYCIFNDLADEHTSSFGVEIGLEIHLMAYTSKNSESIFLEYFIISRKSIPYKNIKVGFFLGGECGNKYDNFAGSNSSFPYTTFIYNGDNQDEGFFENEIPFVYASFLNENLSESIAFTGSTEKNGSPNSNADYLNYMNTRWKDGSELTLGGNGQNSGSPYNYIYNENNTPPWREIGTNAPGQRNILGITNSGPMEKNDYFKLDLSIGTGTVAHNGIAYNEINHRAANDKDEFRSVSRNNSKRVENAFLVYPNPTSGSFFIKNLQQNSILNIYNYQGVKVYSESILKNNIFQCNVHLSSGIYTLELVNSDGTFKQTLSITH